MPRRTLLICTLVVMASSLGFGWASEVNKPQFFRAKVQPKYQLAEKRTAAAAPTATSAAVETPIIILDARQVTDVLGKSVRDSRGEDVGRIVDVIVSRGGQMRAAVMDFGGFLGVGSRKVAVGWNVLSFPPDSSADRIGIELTRNQLRLAPEYRPGAPIVVLGANEDGAIATEDSIPEQ